MDKEQKPKKQKPSQLSLASLSLADDPKDPVNIPLPPSPPAPADTSSHQEEKTVPAPEAQVINDLAMKQLASSMSLLSICQYVIHYMTTSDNRNLLLLPSLISLLQVLTQILQFPLPEVPHGTPPGKTLSIFTSHLQQMLLNPSTSQVTLSIANIFLSQTQDMLSSYTINDLTNGAVKLQDLTNLYTIYLQAQNSASSAPTSNTPAFGNAITTPGIRSPLNTSSSSSHTARHPTDEPLPQKELTGDSSPFMDL